MGFYQFRKKQSINASVEATWEFISNPNNLKLITPEYMGFDITSKHLPTRMYAGMIISYRVSPFLGIKTNWVTEITQVKENAYFVDEQRVGPYSIWHHQHILEPSNEGTSMIDIVSYKPPFGVLGSMANGIFIKRKLEDIFQFRTEALAKIF
jgi:ligand-binding SRPBCC domain-containing protein